MKFGAVENPERIDFTLPSDHPDTARVLAATFSLGQDRGTSYASEAFAKVKYKGLQVCVGGSQWNRRELKGFYPKGIKDELRYYSRQFNSIEFNASFYRLFPKEQFVKWHDTVPDSFRFFPKITHMISHRKRLIDAQDFIPDYIDHVVMLKEKLGTIFLQMHNNFQPKDFERVKNFVNHWPTGVPIALEFRHPYWFTDLSVAADLYALLERHNIANVLVDTPGRRDIMHMRLTNNEAFVRFVGANHPCDYGRIDDWVARLKQWVDLGLRKINFFIHQNMTQDSTLLASYFIERLNPVLGIDLNIPHLANRSQKTLF